MKDETGPPSSLSLRERVRVRASVFRPPPSDFPFRLPNSAFRIASASCGTSAAWPSGGALETRTAGVRPGVGVSLRHVGRCDRERQAGWDWALRWGLTRRQTEQIERCGSARPPTGLRRTLLDVACSRSLCAAVILGSSSAAVTL